MSTQRGGTATGKFDCSTEAGIPGGLVPEGKHLLGPILTFNRLRGWGLRKCAAPPFWSVWSSQGFQIYYRSLTPFFFLLERFDTKLFLKNCSLHNCTLGQEHFDLFWDLPLLIGFVCQGTWVNSRWYPDMACKTHLSCVIFCQLPMYWVSLAASLGLFIDKSIWLINTSLSDPLVHPPVLMWG